MNKWILRTLTLVFLFYSLAIIVLYSLEDSKRLPASEGVMKTDHYIFMNHVRK